VNAELYFRLFDSFEKECQDMLRAGLVLPAYDYCMKCSTASTCSTRARHRHHRAAALHRPGARPRQGLRRAVRQGAGAPRLPHARARGRKRAQEAFDAHLEAGVSRRRWRRRGRSPDARRAPDRGRHRGDPAAFLTRALEELPALAKARLAAARLEHGEIVALGAPRRLALHVRDLPERQATSPRRSPAAGVGSLRQGGKPTRAALASPRRPASPSRS